MDFRKILLGLIMGVLALTTMNVAFASEIEVVEEEKDAEVCGFELPDEDKDYSAEFISVRRKLRVEVGEEFRVKVFVKNTGNMTWFSSKSECRGPEMSLGTDKERDRESSIYDIEMDGWEGSNRVNMDQNRIDPGEIASFTFYGKAPEDPDVLVEYYTPVLTGIEWLDEAQFNFEVIVGDNEESAVDLRKRLSYSHESGSVMDLNLDGERKILVDLSEQWMYVYLDDDVIKSFQISTGAYATPTPIGTTYISLKQELRVGGKSPHYIMPYFQMFRAGGYGLHALPSLGNDGGVFWTEAVSHLGIPVSHGCIRIGDDNAIWLFGYTDIGTEVTVQA